MFCASPPPVWLHAAGLPQAWAAQPDWRVLDTDFDDGQRFLQLWQAWSHDSQACERLHVVALCTSAPAPDILVRAATTYGVSADCTRALEQQWFGLMPGFQRLVFAGGRLRLTLCIGPTRTLLRQQQFVADSVVVGAPLAQGLPDDAPVPVPWDAWALKSLARLCRRGSTLAVLPKAGIDTRLLAATGWQQRQQLSPADPPCTLWGGDFQPHWQIKSSRYAWARPPAPASHCIVIGAGLAGAAVADALAQRGRRVTVLDAAPTPGCGASGLPVGLFTPQVSHDDGTRARLSRAGIRMTLLAARQRLQSGQDWALTGVVQFRHTHAPALPTHWPVASASWACLARADEHAYTIGSAQPTDCDPSLWHATAGWIKPAQLVQAWLAHPAVRFIGRSRVGAVTQQNGQWRISACDGGLLAEAPQLVIACAGNSFAMVHLALVAAGLVPKVPLPTLSATQGQVSWAHQRAADTACFPRVPVNGAGSVVAHVPHARGAAWFAGATYEAASVPPLTEAAAHAQNLARMNTLAPRAADAVAAEFADGAVHAWRGTRWSSLDRLPIVGAWPIAAGATTPGLWVSTAMGSRGLTYAALCGELIAAQMGAEPLPLEPSLHGAIDVRRLRVGAQPRQAAS